MSELRYVIYLHDRQGNVAAEVEVDEIDYLWASKFNWHRAGDPPVYAARNIPIPLGPRRQEHIMLHHEIIERMGHNRETFDVVDHEDRNTFNCRRYNLRPATFLLNAQNRTVVPNHGRPRTLLEPEPRPCEGCGEEYTPIRKKQFKSRFCSRKCQIAYARKKVRS